MDRLALKTMHSKASVLAAALKEWLCTAYRRLHAGAVRIPGVLWRYRKTNQTIRTYVLFFMIIIALSGNSASSLGVVLLIVSPLVALPII